MLYIADWLGVPTWNIYNCFDVTQHPDGCWQVKGEGNSGATARTSTQKETIDIGREISRNQRSELVIHRPDGTIRDKDSHGHDPYPPKG